MFFPSASATLSQGFNKIVFLMFLGIDTLDGISDCFPAKASTPSL